MFEIRCRNVNGALTTLMHYLTRHRSDPEVLRTVSPREMETLEFIYPVATTYIAPWECVLFNPVRDANPFFHFMEAMWMLGGRDDVAFLHRFNKNMENFSDDGETFHGAYGRRWYRWEALSAMIELLAEDPDTRRAVLAMYHPDMDVMYRGKDVPCNLNATFKIRDGRLHMTVFCRSNDALWGAYGANAVHFSILQQVVAACLNVPIGFYTQISDSFHVYTQLYDLVPKLSAAAEAGDHTFLDPYGKVMMTEPVVQSPMGISYLQLGCRSFCDFVLDSEDTASEQGFGVDIIDYIAAPMADAWAWHKYGDDRRAMDAASRIKALDWSLACQLWLSRRSGVPLIDPENFNGANEFAQILHGGSGEVLA